MPFRSHFSLKSLRKSAFAVTPPLIAMEFSPQPSAARIVFSVSISQTHLRNEAQSPALSTARFWLAPC
jgi:hypothetical protein